MTKRILALSPHLDDAAFSCGGTLAMLAQAGWHVTVTTLFTQSVPNPNRFALACQLDKGLGADVDYMALRRTEDAAAMRTLGVSFMHAALREAPHRGYESAEALFGPPSAGDTIGTILRSVIDDQIFQIKPDFIFAPQAIGGHVDHVQVVRALEGMDRSLVWWQDFPYTIRSTAPAEPFAVKMRTLPIRSVRLDKSAIMSREAACLAYASQLDFQFGGAIGLATKLRQAGSIEFFRSSHGFTIT